MKTAEEIREWLKYSPADAGFVPADLVGWREPGLEWSFLCAKCAGRLGNRGIGLNVIYVAPEPVYSDFAYLSRLGACRGCSAPACTPSATAIGQGL